VSFFIEEGADINIVDSRLNSFSLLHDAARRGHTRVVCCVLHSFVKADIYSLTGTPVSYARDQIRILLEHGLQYDVKDASGDTPLHWCAHVLWVVACLEPHCGKLWLAGRLAGINMTQC
jgi:ankyrin repeat protein